MDTEEKELRVYSVGARFVKGHYKPENKVYFDGYILDSIIRDRLYIKPSKWGEINVECPFGYKTYLESKNRGFMSEKSWDNLCEYLERLYHVILIQPYKEV